MLHALFISNTFTSNTRLKLAKNQAKLSNTLRLDLCYLKIICYLNPRYHPKVIGNILKKVQKSKCVFFNEVIRIIMKMEMKKRSYRYDINSLRPRHWCKHTKYKIFLNMVMPVCITQHLSNIRSRNHKKVK